MTVTGHHGRLATHVLTWTSPGQRDEPVSDTVCAECAECATPRLRRRPALQATARKITEGAR